MWAAASGHDAAVTDLNVGGVASLRERLAELRRDIEAEALRRRAQIDAVPAAHRASALNLAHYVGLRKKDLRRLQLELGALALSSLGRSEGHVSDTLARLARWLGEPAAAAGAEPALDWAAAEKLLHDNTRALFGPKPRDRHVYVMVTAAEAAEATPEWADAILRAGADVLRINAAHGTPEEWQAVIATARARAAELERGLRVYVDLAGPKLRGEIRRMEAGVLHLPRRKSRSGRTLGPTRVTLVARYEGGAQIPVPRGWLTRLHPGDVLEMTDAGGRERELVVRDTSPGGVIAECHRSLYVSGGLPIAWKRGKKAMKRGRIGRYPRRPASLELAQGSVFLVNGTGRAAKSGLPAIACPEPRLLAKVRPGERLVLDDGRIVALVEACTREGLRCRVRETTKPRVRLRTGKGLAFPDSRLPPGRLGKEDLRVLEFALAHADGVEVSFVNTPADVRQVGERVRAAGRPAFGMILKLETREAMRNLPEILFEALRYRPVGIMIARGDLAVALSYERLAEMQEELLWFGEACHLPVVWATQVLDSLTHGGVPTRAEVTDAAMSMRAECVMLNRGPHVAEAVKMLVNIIRKMEAHQYKKRSLYRPLALALGAGPG
jgi:pyruvate kinase